MHWDFDIYIRNRVDTSPAPMDWKTMTATLGGFFGIMMLFFVLGEVFPSYQPVVRFIWVFVQRVHDVKLLPPVRREND